MDAASLLKEARLYIGLSQRALADKTGVAQSTVARIESGAMDPRSSTLEKLLRGCHRELDIRVVRNFGIDPTLIVETLKQTPEDRVRSNTNFVKFANEMRAALRPKR